MSDYSTSSTRSWRFELRATPTAAGPSRSAARRRSSRDGELDPVDQAAGVEAVVAEMVSKSDWCSSEGGVRAGVAPRQWIGGRGPAVGQRSRRVDLPATAGASATRTPASHQRRDTKARTHRVLYAAVDRACRVTSGTTGRQGRQGQPEFCPAASGLRQGGTPRSRAARRSRGQDGDQGLARWPTRIGCEGRSATKRPMLQARSCHL